MGTMAHIAAQGATRDDLGAAFAALKEYDADLRIDAESNALRSAALVVADSYRDRTCGAFEPRIGRLTLLWGFSSDSPRIPSPAMVRAALRDTTVLDFGGIGKGMAAESAAQILKARGIASAIINLGGNIQTVGAAPRGDAWRIAVVHPRKTDEAIAMILLPAGRAVATSGDYERFLIAGGKRYHHILDPRTGYPAERTDTDATIVSVSIVSPSATAADAWSTGAFVLGWPEGFRRVESEPDLEGLFILEHADGRIEMRKTSGLVTEEGS